MSRNLERERRISLYMKLGNGSTSRGTYKRMMRIFAKKRLALSTKKMGGR